MNIIPKMEVSSALYRRRAVVGLGLELYRDLGTGSYA